MEVNANSVKVSALDIKELQYYYSIFVAFLNKFRIWCDIYTISHVGITGDFGKEKSFKF